MVIDGATSLSFYLGSGDGNSGTRTAIALPTYLSRQSQLIPIDSFSWVRFVVVFKLFGCSYPSKNTLTWPTPCTLLIQECPHFVLVIP